MAYIPSALRRGGYDYPAPDCSRPVGGYSGLGIVHQRALRQGVEHVRGLGDRALAELLVELAESRADLPETLTILGAWRSRLTPEMTRAAGADTFPGRQLRRVA